VQTTGPLLLWLLRRRGFTAGPSELSIEVVFQVLSDAEVFGNFPGLQIKVDLLSPRRRIHLRVVDLKRDLHAAVVHAVKALGKLECVAMRMAGRIKPGFIPHSHFELYLQTIGRSFSSMFMQV
jgi:hypothetical protein